MTQFLILHNDIQARQAMRKSIAQENVPKNVLYMTGDLDEGREWIEVVVDPTIDLIVIIDDHLDGRNADDVAMAIKAVRLTARVFVFTSEDTRRLLPNGQIPKGGDGVGLLARFIRSIHARGYDLVRLRTEFPEIKFTAGSTQ
jgi:hypothetical protein